ncbi:MAG: hypothetical protein JWN15_1620 [Firmicutes bacterium]|nr:hypothetical protein [Bacillota bacterium]
MPLYIGGILIRRFDGFRRLCRHAAEEYHLPLTITEEEMLLANRVLAALGGPPAPAEVRGRFSADGLPALLLFLLTQEYPCRIGLLGDAEAVITRLKSLVHLLGHGACPVLSGEDPLGFQEVVKELGPNGVVLRPLFRYDEAGEPVGFEPEGAAGAVRVGPGAGPYTLTVVPGQGARPASLACPGGDLHPAILVLG